MKYVLVLSVADSMQAMLANEWNKWIQVNVSPCSYNQIGTIYLGWPKSEKDNRV